MTQPPWLLRVFGVSAFVGIVGWAALMALAVWWLFQPVPLPNVKEPLPVVNIGKRVYIGDNLYIRLDVSKTAPLVPVDSSRYIACTSGNLITLTASPIRLPLGTYSIITEDIIIPERILPGDTCIFELSVTYQVNPLRQETVDLMSEQFKVLEKPS